MNNMDVSDIFYILSFIFWSVPRKKLLIANISLRIPFYVLPLNTADIKINFIYLL